MKKILYVLLLILSGSAFGQGFLHQDGQNIVDGNGENVLLRGLGLGGWMVQEGYMMQTDAFAGPQHKIRQKIQELIGAENTEAFYQAYRDNGITKRDIDSLKAWGFNSVRLPMHYNLYTLPIEQEPVAGQNTWLEEGFERTDLLLQWCAENEMYLILDMHAAPGGQGMDANISDYDNTKPSLWESAANRQKLVALWQELAERYSDEEWIGAYDLINEPNWNFTGTNQNGCDETSNAPLRALMVDITEAIRQVDQNHMIIIEGNCWGNNYNGIFPLWDDNMTVSFHKYWNQNTQASIQTFLNYRQQYNVPIWLGESGENSNVWFRDAISLVESNNIGWAFWPMKKIESIAGVTAVTKTPEYQQLLNYWNNGGTQPTQAFATEALMQMAENYSMENVTVKPDVIDAMFRQVQTTETVPYTTHSLPGKVYAATYDLGPHEYAYADNDIANYRTDTGTFEDWNKGWAMRNDGVDIQPCDDTTTNGFMVGYIEPHEWILFTLTADELTAYDVDIRYAGIGGSLHLEDENGRISEKITLASTGGFTTWNTVTLTDVLLKEGINKIKVYFDTGGFNLNYLEFKNPRPSDEAAFKVIDASVNYLGNRVNVLFNKELQEGINFNQSQLTLKVNGEAVAVEEMAVSANGNGFTLDPENAINQDDVVTLSYAGTNIIAADATVQAVFTDMPVANRVGDVYEISGLIQAEDFYINSGLELENTSDTGNGENIGYTDPGDYLDYLVNVNQEGNYKIEYRTSGESQTGQVTLQIITDDGVQDVQTVSFTPTGGWQTWQTVVTNAQLPAGRYILRVLVVNGGFNLNWIKFSYMLPDDDNDGVPNESDICPDTPEGDVVDFNGCTLFTLPGNNFAVLATGESCRTANDGSIAIIATQNHGYVATVTGNGVSENTNFTETTTFTSLEAGTYQVCITVPDAPSYQQCFDLTITEPEDLSVFSRLMQEEYQVEINLSGGSSYTISLNGEVYTTTQDTIVLELKPGSNDLEVTTDKACQGIYREKIVIDATPRVYPNPVNGDMVYVALATTGENAVNIEIYTLQGKRVANYVFNGQDNVLSVDTATLSAGMYMMNIVSGGNVYNTKIVKL